MDLTRRIGYRGFNLNSIRSDSQTRDMVGCEVTRASYHGVQGVGYDEKKAMADGYDSADVWLGKRAISLSGNLYGRTRAELFDILTDFLGKVSPTAAYDEAPSNKGFLPLDFYLPTERLQQYNDDNTLFNQPWYSTGTKSGDGPFPNGLRHVCFMARPVSMPDLSFVSDMHGGPDDGALSVAWTAVLEARLPWMLNYAFTEQAMGQRDGDSGTVRNRGNRPAAFELKLIVPYKYKGNMTDAGGLRLIGLGTNMRISVPAVNADQTIRYDSYHKVLSVNGALRMDLLTFAKGFDHGKVRVGSTSWEWHQDSTKNLKAGSYFRFRDTWA